MAEPVDCPVCGRPVPSAHINEHIDSDCSLFTSDATQPRSQEVPNKSTFSAFFQRSTQESTSHRGPPHPSLTQSQPSKDQSLKRNIDNVILPDGQNEAPASAKKTRPNALEQAAPLAERMRPKTLDDVCGQELVGKTGILRGLIESGRVPSMCLWGGPGTGKTTIARLIAGVVGARFVEINSTASGVAECKRIFSDARNELALTGRKTIVFCDEIHRFSKSQQDVFLGPVEAGHITLIGATTENPSFKIVNALLSRCRTFTLNKLSQDDVVKILRRALVAEGHEDADAASSAGLPLLDEAMLGYMAAFADGDGRTALNLLEIAISLSQRSGITKDELKRALQHTLVYDRAGDSHYDSISALHKSVRGSDPDAAVYYLARMLESGEDPLFIARRMVVMASEDIGLANNEMLSLATATYTACEKIGMPECRINLAHCAVALSLSPKSTRSYRALNNAYAALREPGVAGLPIPLHLRNAPTRLMKEIGYGKAYKYNPDYVDGRVVQEYLPEPVKGRKFLEDRDLGTQVDPELATGQGEQPPDEFDEHEPDDTLEHSSFTVGDGTLELLVD